MASCGGWLTLGRSDNLDTDRSARRPGAKAKRKAQRASRRRNR